MQDAGPPATMAAVQQAVSFWDRRRAAVRTVTPYAGLLVIPAVLWAFLLKATVDGGDLAFDFHHFFYPQARDVLAGRVPAGTAYPAATSVLLAPFALLPRSVADVVVTLLALACAIGTLRTLGVRDWRCYGAAALWGPVFSAVQTANLSLLLTLGVALVWRWRDRAALAGTSAAVVVALKLFLWPLVVWLAVGGRWRAAATTLAVGVAGSAVAWGVVGLGVLTELPTHLREMVQIDGARAYTPAALLRGIGLASPAAYTMAVAAGLAVLVGAAGAARRGRPAHSLTLVIAAALTITPIAWTHYFTLLLVPVALARPRFSPLWLAPLPMWLCPPTAGAVWQKAVVLGVAAAMIVVVTAGTDLHEEDRRPRLGTA